MHEMGMCDEIVKATLRRAAGRRVRRVRVRVGGHPVDPAVVEQGFKLAAIGTVAEQAEVSLVLEPLSVDCRGCGQRTPVAQPTELAACPRCGGVDVEVSGSDSVVLEFITVDDPGPAGGAEAVGGSATVDGSARCAGNVPEPLGREH